MRIIGIDPGSRVTGYGVIDSNGVSSQYRVSGVIRTRSESFPERLGEIFSGLKAVLNEHRPSQMAIEEVFLSRNPSSALKLGQARGAAICAGVDGGLPIAEYSARSIKQAVVGKGSADKDQVQYMIRLLLKLSHEPVSDEADALATALTHAHTLQLEKRLNGAGRIA
jgi:crossover junction endodeoxyribonuclease RuvC